MIKPINRPSVSQCKSVPLATYNHNHTRISSFSFIYLLLFFFSLGNLYNITQNRELRFLVFTTLLNYAIESNNNDHILSLLDTLNERFKEWNATNSQKREIYKLARRAVQDRDKYHKRTTFHSIKERKKVSDQLFGFIDTQNINTM